MFATRRIADGTRLQPGIDGRACVLLGNDATTQRTDRPCRFVQAFASRAMSEGISQILAAPAWLDLDGKARLGSRWPASFAARRFEELLGICDAACTWLIRRARILCRAQPTALAEHWLSTG
jgi:hypothetical protein